jgi:hypothetical protein
MSLKSKSLHLPSYRFRALQSTSRDDRFVPKALQNQISGFISSEPIPIYEPIGRDLSKQRRRPSTTLPVEFADKNGARLARAQPRRLLGSTRR